jgi:p-hydroxybenzoate 3-monooxygenase
LLLAPDEKITTLDMRTQVGIIGAGPAGLFLSHLLKQGGVDSVVLEARSRASLESRIRAGVLEPGTVETMRTLGLDSRLKQIGKTDDALTFRFDGRTINLDLYGLTGQRITIYAQHEIVKDLVAARTTSGEPLLFEAKVEAIDNLDGDRPVIRYHQGQDRAERTLECDFVAGCDGYHGLARVSLPRETLQTYNHTYDFAWLGVLARSKPLGSVSYSSSERGFALCSRRSPEISRLYLQVGSDETPEDWTERRFWDELHARMFDEAHTEIAEGEIFNWDVVRLRAFVACPMQYRRVFLVGDAAHVVPPAGAKGLNLAVHDTRVLARGLTDFYSNGSRGGLDQYSECCLSRVWRTVRFSMMLTGLLHKFPSHTPLERKLQLAELNYIADSHAAQTSIAEQYVGV